MKIYLHMHVIDYGPSLFKKIKYRKFIYHHILYKEQQRTSQKENNK